MGISLSETKEIINPDLAKLLLEAINEGFKDFNGLDEKTRAICSGTTRAMFVNDHMVHHAKDILGNRADVQFVVRHGRIHVVIGQQPDKRIEVKLKKLNHNKRPSNILTNTVLAYNSQIPLKFPCQLELADMPSPIANLIAGYKLNSLRTGIEAIYVVCPQGSDNSWEWKLDSVGQPTMIPESQLVSSFPKPIGVVPKKKAVTEHAA